MALSQRLQIRQSQALVMTPQLMQAIKLLQLSNLDLVAYVEAELERNPLLDRGSEPDAPGEADGTPASADATADGGADNDGEFGGDDGGEFAAAPDGETGGDLAANPAARSN